MCSRLLTSDSKDHEITPKSWNIFGVKITENFFIMMLGHSQVKRTVTEKKDADDKNEYKNLNRKE